MCKGKVHRLKTTAALTTALERSAETIGSVVSEFANRPKRVPSRSLTAGFYPVCQCPRFEQRVYQGVAIAQKSPEGHAQFGMRSMPSAYHWM
jgi:hypothetical protein